MKNTEFLLLISFFPFLFSGYPVVNDPLYNHDVFGPLKGKGGDLGGKTDEELVTDLIHIHNAENWLGMDSDNELSIFTTRKSDLDDSIVGPLVPKGKIYYLFSISQLLSYENILTSTKSAIIYGHLMNSVFPIN